MRKGFAFILLVAAVLVSTMLGQVKVAPMNIRERTLPNGLRVVSLQDNSSATVSIHVWYDVGSKDDPEGRS